MSDTDTTTSPTPQVMASTPGTLTTIRNGQTTTGPVTIVHHPGVIPETEIEHRCDSSCGRQS